MRRRPITLELAADVIRMRVDAGWTGRIRTLALPGHRSILFVTERPPEGT